ncbi:MAG TPA: hypothetical protein VD828_01560 [Candidatus Nitrosotenuis sp.]|nr:hypothetical protein [Candidatus Nitrosotenuis sp.]
MLFSSVSLGTAFAIDSPKKQLANGVAPKDVVCKAGRVLAIIFTNTPVCLKPSTASELEKRWSTTLVFPEPAQPKDDAPKNEPSAKGTTGATIQGQPGKAQAVVETIPASGGSTVNFYITDDDLNTSPNGVDIISTEGLLEFTINDVSIEGPETMIETGPNTGKFYVGLELPETVNGQALTQNDVIVIRYLDQSDAAGESRVSVTSVPLSKTYAQVQTSGGGQSRIGHEFSVRIYEPDANLDSKEVDRIPLSRIEFRAEGGIRTTLANPAFDANSSYLLESGENSGTFQVVIKIPRTIDGKTIHIGDWYEMTYVDASTPSDTSEKIVLKGKIG